MSRLTIDKRQCDLRGSYYDFVSTQQESMVVDDLVCTLHDSDLPVSNGTNLDGNVGSGSSEFSALIYGEVVANPRIGM